MDKTKEQIMRALICVLAMDYYYRPSNKNLILDSLGIEDDGEGLTNEKVFAALDKMFGEVDEDGSA